MAKKVTKKKTKKEVSNKQEETNPQKEKSSNEKLIRNTLIISISIIALILIFYFYVDSLKSFEYKNLEFETISYGDLIFYQTNFNVIYEGETRQFNAFFRTKPTKLEKINFQDEDFSAMKYTVINVQENLSCEGDDVIAVANFNQIHNAIGAQVFQDENATCDEDARYNHLTILQGDKTEINKLGPRCYELTFKDCEILEVTERYLLELMNDYVSN